MNRILVAVDMQNDFVSGSLGTEQAIAIVPNVIAKIKYYRENKSRIFATQDTHFLETYLSTQEGQNLPVIHTIKNTWGWELVDGVKELILPTEIWRKSTFGSVEAMQMVAKIAKETGAVVEFVGLYIDICVIANIVLFKSFAPEIKVIVDSKCCAGITQVKFEAAIEILRSLQVEVI